MPSVRTKGPARKQSRKTKKEDKIELLESPALGELPWLVHGFTTRKGGASHAYGGNAFNLAFTEDDTRTEVGRNRELLLRRLPRPTDGDWRLATLRQIHSAIVWDADGEGSGESPKAGDGLMTDRPGLLLGIKTADCIPVIVADTRRRVVAAFHAGWRGTAARIVEKGVGEMKRRFGTNPKDIRAAIGPGIHACCYEVGAEMREPFRSQFAYADELFTESASDDEIHRKYPLLFMNMRAPGHGEPPSKLHLDLPEANRRQLLAAGVGEEHIQVSDLCTACRTDLLFSHRAEGGKTGRMMAVVGIR